MKGFSRPEVTVIIRSLSFEHGPKISLHAAAAAAFRDRASRSDDMVEDIVSLVDPTNDMTPSPRPSGPLGGVRARMTSLTKLFLDAGHGRDHNMDDVNDVLFSPCEACYPSFDVWNTGNSKIPHKLFGMLVLGGRTRRSHRRPVRRHCGFGHPASTIMTVSIDFGRLWQATPFVKLRQAYFRRQYTGENTWTRDLVFLVLPRATCVADSTV